jgi:hypothetical protein
MLQVRGHGEDTAYFFLRKEIRQFFVPQKKRYLNIFTQHFVILGDRKLVVIMGASCRMPIKKPFTKCLKILF